MRDLWWARKSNSGPALGESLMLLLKPSSRWGPRSNHASPKTRTSHYR